MDEEVDICSMADEPGRFGPVEPWERYLEAGKRLPMNALERQERIRRAQSVIADIRKHSRAPK